MPIYEYQCQDCGHQLEKLQQMSDAPLTDCPHCQQPSLTKLVSAAGFQLKGSGWYVTDFRNKTKPADTNTESKTQASLSDGATANKETTGSNPSPKESATKKASDD